jgi:hypothetical protein
MKKSAFPGGRSVWRPTGPGRARRIRVRRRRQRLRTGEAIYDPVSTSCARPARWNPATFEGHRPAQHCLQTTGWITHSNAMNRWSSGWLASPRRELTRTANRADSGCRISGGRGTARPTALAGEAQAAGRSFWPGAALCSFCRTPLQGSRRCPREGAPRSRRQVHPPRPTALTDGAAEAAPCRRTRRHARRRSRTKRSGAGAAAPTPPDRCGRQPRREGEEPGPRGRLPIPYQVTRTPKRMTRGATMPLIRLAFDAFCSRRRASTVLTLVRLKMSMLGTTRMVPTLNVLSTRKSSV